jgi:hypothetical protein
LLPHFAYPSHHPLRSANNRPVRLAYQPPASSTFLSEQISHQQPANNTFLSEQTSTSTSHQPPANRTGMFIRNFFLKRISEGKIKGTDNTGI